MERERSDKDPIQPARDEIPNIRKKGLTLEGRKNTSPTNAGKKEVKTGENAD